MAYTWLCLPPPPAPLEKTKSPLKNSMFPNLHEIFYHMMCLAFESKYYLQQYPRTAACLHA